MADDYPRPLGYRVRILGFWPPLTCRHLLDALQVLAADPVQRELCLGLPVASGDTVVLLHSSSGHFLSVGRKLVENDFGIEAGVVTGTVHGHGKRHVCEQASQVLTSDLERHTVLRLACV